MKASSWLCYGCWANLVSIRIQQQRSTAANSNREVSSTTIAPKPCRQVAYSSSKPPEPTGCGLKTDSSSFTSAASSMWGRAHFQIPYQSLYITELQLLLLQKHIVQMECTRTSTLADGPKQNTFSDCMGSKDYGLRADSRLFAEKHRLPTTFASQQPSARPSQAKTRSSPKCTTLCCLRCHLGVWIVW